MNRRKYVEGDRVRTDTGLADEDGQVGKVRGRVVGDDAPPGRVQILTEEGTIYVVPEETVRREGK